LAGKSNSLPAAREIAPSRWFDGACPVTATRDFFPQISLMAEKNEIAPPRLLPACAGGAVGQKS
jgi:hypothetical protein